MPVYHQNWFALMGTISVVLASYNGSRFVSQQLESLAAQTLSPHELIVSDDQSSDETVSLIEEFGRTAPFPVLIHRNESRLGYGANFLQAARMASGDLIAFCDQDDIWLPVKLELSYERLVANQVDLVVHTAFVITSTGARVGWFGQGIKDERLYGPLNLSPWGVYYGFTMLFRRQLLEVTDSASRGRHTFEHDGILSHDLWVYLLATSLGHTLVIPQPLAEYRRHEGNITPPVLGDRFRQFTASLGLASDAKLARDEIADHRSELFSRVSLQSPDAELRALAGNAALYWKRVAEFVRMRMHVYARDSAKRTRGRVLLQLALKGGYRNHQHHGLGYRLLAKDLLAGVAGWRRKENR